MFSLGILATLFVGFLVLEVYPYAKEIFTQREEEM